MKMSQGVEWGLHCAILLGQMPAGKKLTRRQLALHYGVPEAYLGKHLNALVRAGVLAASGGPDGGYRLARPPEAITALDIVTAIEGSTSPFVCTEIRQQGAAALPRELCLRPCGVSAVMAKAQAAWRKSLEDQDLASLIEALPRSVRERIAARYDAQSAR
jgi:Rrf2 family protein